MLMARSLDNRPTGSPDPHRLPRLLEDAAFRFIQTLLLTMLFRQIADDLLAQYAYLIGCQKTGEALLIDPQRDIDRYLALAERENLRIVAVAETHIHADFLSGCRAFAAAGVTVYLSDEGRPDWSYAWADDDADVRLLRDGDRFSVGNIDVEARHTPGHTPEHLSFLITDRGGGADAPMGLVSGDFVFVGDVGRPDLLETAAGEIGAQEPAARQLYRSVLEFLDLPDYMQLWPGHGAGSACGKALGAVPESTIGYEKRFNGALQAARHGEDGFVDEILDGQPEPPLYFGRMKRLNREGPPLLDAIPAARRLETDALKRLAGQTTHAVLDLRRDRSTFMRGHLPASLYAPFDKSFATVAGSYVPPEQSIYLIADEADVEEAARCLVRIGLDGLVGYATPAQLALYAEGGGQLAQIEEIDFEEVETRRQRDGVAVVDVRKASEYRAGHVPHAIHAAHTRLLELIDDLPEDRKLLVHCQSGARSAVAAALLCRHGFDVTYVNGQFRHAPTKTDGEGTEAADLAVSTNA